jgi:uncharacterized membrane protein
MDENKENSAISFERIVFFSDAVFAIVITLLVLEIKVPSHLTIDSSEALHKELAHLIPKFLGFVCSFFIVGLMWFEHHRIFRFIEGFSAGLIWRNLIFLLVITFIPFPTGLFSEYPWSITAFLIYTMTFGLAALAKFWLWTYAVKNSLIRPGTDPSTVTRISRRSLGVPLGCLTCVILALFLPTYFAFFGFPLIPLFAYLLDPPKKAKIDTPDEIQVP